MADVHATTRLCLEDSPFHARYHNISLEEKGLRFLSLFESHVQHVRTLGSLHQQALSFSMRPPSASKEPLSRFPLGSALSPAGLQRSASQSEAQHPVPAVIEDCRRPCLASAIRSLPVADLRRQQLSVNPGNLLSSCLSVVREGDRGSLAGPTPVFEAGNLLGPALSNRVSTTAQGWQDMIIHDLRCRISATAAQGDRRACDASDMVSSLTEQFRQREREARAVRAVTMRFQEQAAALELENADAAILRASRVSDCDIVDFQHAQEENRLQSIWKASSCCHEFEEERILLLTQLGVLNEQKSALLQILEGTRMSDCHLHGSDLQGSKFAQSFCDEADDSDQSTQAPCSSVGAALDAGETKYGPTTGL